MRGLTADRRRTAQIELAEHSSAHIFGYHDQGCTGYAGKREGSDLQANVEGVLVNRITPLRLEAYKDEGSFSMPERRSRVARQLNAWQWTFTRTVRTLTPSHRVSGR